MCDISPVSGDSFAGVEVIEMDVDLRMVAADGFIFPDFVDIKDSFAHV